jgi:hypothetical protein
MPPEPLDYQSPRQATPNALAATCSRCGGSDLVQGITSSIALRFLPKQVRSFWMFNSGVKTRVFACLACGALTAEINPDDLRVLMAK